MKRREFFLKPGCGMVLGRPLFAAVKQDKLDAAAEILTRAVARSSLQLLNPVPAIRRQRVGIGTALTGGSWAHPGVVPMVRPRTWHAFSTSSSIPPAKP